MMNDVDTTEHYARFHKRLQNIQIIVFYILLRIKIKTDYGHFAATIYDVGMEG